MTKKTSNFIAVLLLLTMAIVAILSMRDESAIMDEVAHIPAGYSYLSQKDMRLNPEHPPLLKDLSAIPLLFIKARLDSQGGADARQGINFPDEIEAWQDKVNGQWDFGFKFLYQSNNNADKIIFWSRIPMILILLILGIYIFQWTKELFGSKIALFALFLFTFSPTFIAHGRYVTTDVGAAAGFFIATYYFIKWLKKHTTKHLILAGISFGIAQLLKFSLILLVPYFGLLLLIWIILNRKNFWQYIWKFILILIVGYIIVYPLYAFHVWNYPTKKQISDIDFISSQFPLKPVHKALAWMVEKPILRPYAQYFLGLFMVFQRATGGNTNFFLGEVTNKGWHYYFPIVYAIKTPLTLHIFTILALLFIAWPYFAKATKGKQKCIKIIKKSFPELAMLIFLAVYWTSSITSNLNIGVRHILPTFPFVYILVSGQIKRIFDYLKKIKPSYAIKLIISILFAFLIFWYGFSSLSIFPYYLTYFNELVGGSENGYKYVTDSNLDWGQDLKRLAQWTEERNIEKIKVDYFGGGMPEYYLGNKFEKWWGERDPKEAQNSWLAVSATFLQQGRAVPTKGWDQPTDYYMWLNEYEPVEIVGNSIFIFYIE